MITEKDLEITTVKCYDIDRPRIKTLGQRLKLLERGSSSQPYTISRALDALNREINAAIEVFNSMDPKKGGVK